MGQAASVRLSTPLKTGWSPTSSRPRGRHPERLLRQKDFGWALPSNPRREQRHSHQVGRDKERAHCWGRERRGGPSAKPAQHPAARVAYEERLHGWRWAPAGATEAAGEPKRPPSVPPLWVVELGRRVHRGQKKGPPETLLNSARNRLGNCDSPSGFIPIHSIGPHLHFDIHAFGKLSLFLSNLRTETCKTK